MTFSLAAAHTKPDVVVFLGDLMDEGSQATAEEYRDTYYRFLNIFSHFPDVKVKILFCLFVCFVYGYYFSKGQ
jgi:hypothetical protein